MKKIFLFISLIIFINNASAQQNSVPLLNVNGEHTIKIEPDGAIVIVMVSSTDLDLKVAKSTNDKIISSAIAYLEEIKVDKKDIRTTHLDLQPFNEYVKDEKPIQHFRAQQSLTFNVKDLSQLSILLSGLVDLGVNNIQNIEFTNTGLKSLQEEARINAVLDAKRKASILATAVGQKIGAAYSITDRTQSSGNQPRPMYRALSDSKIGNVESESALATGEIDITANVEVSFLLEN